MMKSFFPEVGRLPEPVTETQAVIIMDILPAIDCLDRLMQRANLLAD